MNALIAHEIQNEGSIHFEVLDLLSWAHKELEKLAVLVQADIYAPEILWSLYEVQRALCCVVGRLAVDDLNRCLSVTLHTTALSRQQQALAEVVNLYMFVCRQQPQISGKEVLWQHK